VAECDQCGKPAIVEVSGHPLCVDCNLKDVQAKQIRDRILKGTANFMRDEMEAQAGVQGVLPRYKLHTPVILQGPMNFHNINVDRSVVGAINTGNVQKMEVALNEIHAHNTNPQLENSLKQFTEAVLKDGELSAQVKDEIVEQLAVLAAETAKPKESRSAGVVKAVLKSVATSIPSALIEHWDKIKVLLGF
jgi:hypothetical protein